MAVLYSYKLKRPCGYMRPFCRRYVNTFSIDTCGSGDCGTRPPSSVCLRAGTWNLRPPIPCNRCKDQITPSAYLVTLYFEASAWGPYLAEQAGSSCFFQGGVPNEYRVFLAFNYGVPDPAILESAHGLEVATYPTIGVTYGVATYRNWQNVLTSEEGCRQILYFNYHDPVSFGAGVAVAVPVFEGDFGS